MGSPWAPRGHLGLAEHLGGEPAHGPEVMIEVRKHGVREQRVPHGPRIGIRDRRRLDDLE